MTELSVDNAAEWLIRHGLPVAGMQFTELGGGISNKVVLCDGPQFRAVLKQSLGQLRTESQWHSDRERIFREAAAMRWMNENAGNRTSGGHVPGLIFEDIPEFTIAMEAAPRAGEMWKSQLFRGELDPEVARVAGVQLGSMISASWHDIRAEHLFGDQTVFDQLRIDPYYRFTARRRPDAAKYIGNLIHRSAERRVCLVHGDFSPKNLLAHDRSVWVIDWEVIHFGDPSFDVAFLLNHLLMKGIAMPQHRAGMAGLAGAFIDGLAAKIPPDADWIVPAALEHLPALLLARVDGKSPAEYLDAGMRQHASGLALDLMEHPAASAGEVFSR